MSDSPIATDIAVSAAHRHSSAVIVDPCYAVEVLAPAVAPDPGADPWRYGEGELECQRLQVLRARARDAELRVHYPGAFRAPAECAWFRLPASSQRRSAVACGQVIAADPGVEVACPDAQGLTELTIAGGSGRVAVQVEALGEVPALRLADPAGLGCEWSTDGRTWSSTIAHAPCADGGPSHRQELPTVVVPPQGRVGELWDFGCELLGHVEVAAADEPGLGVGESPDEARSDDPGVREQSVAMVAVGSGRWRSAHPLALRYVRFVGTVAGEPVCRAQFHPARYRGAFACSDERLTRIWMHAAYTLRLCMHDFLIDGIKRDRLPWTGDLAISLLADAHAFGDGEIVRRSLVALSSAGIAEQDVNGIVDYSLWWIVCEALYQRHFADPAHLARAWPRIMAAMACLMARSDADGLLGTAGTWLFIDWVEIPKQVSLQILWWWAQVTAADLAEQLGEEREARTWRKRAAALGELLRARGFDAERGLWRGDLHPEAPLARHASFLAVIAGLHGDDPDGALRTALAGDELAAVGTPYMKSFECLALARLGDSDAAVASITAYWGGMLAAGASTFWEAYDPRETGSQRCAFYGRPFARSWCHAWAASPVHLLPHIVLGVEAVADGWSEFRVEPHLGDLSWAACCVPTPTGAITVEADGEAVRVQVPAGSRLVDTPGPGCYRAPLSGGERVGSFVATAG